MVNMCRKQEIRPWEPSVAHSMIGSGCPCSGRNQRIHPGRGMLMAQEERVAHWVKKVPCGCSGSSLFVRL